MVANEICQSMQNMAKVKARKWPKVTEKMANMMIYENLSKKQTKNPIAHEFITYSACERK